MPYVVTTTKPNGDFHGDVSRRAVATLEEVIDAAKAWLWANRDGVTAVELARIEAWDGYEVLELDPLADGTVIEVEYIALTRMWDMCGYAVGQDPPLKPAEIIDAFNGDASPKSGLDR